MSFNGLGLSVSEFKGVSDLPLSMRDLVLVLVQGHCLHILLKNPQEKFDCYAHVPLMEAFFAMPTLN